MILNLKHRWDWLLGMCGILSTQIFYTGEIKVDEILNEVQKEVV